MPELLYWIWLSSLSGLSAAAAKKYIDYFGDIHKLYEAGTEDYKLVLDAKKGEIDALCKKDLKRAEKIAGDCVKKQINVMSINNELYPRRLSYIADPPVVLYYRSKGFPALDEEAVIGVVGTRKASEHGLRTANRIAGELVSCGAVVATGLAEGIDSAAADGALRAGGFVIGVLGTGIDIVYPSFNTGLQKAVAENGLLISEYPPGTRADRKSFPARNRIISGLSVGVLVVEAPERSGSLITARHANEQGRDVFAVPGRIVDNEYLGSNKLLRDGAEFVTSGWDILSGYRLRFPEKLFEKRKKKIQLFQGKNRNTEPFFQRETENSSKKVIDNKSSEGYIDLKDQLDALTEDEVAVVASLTRKALRADEIITETGLGPSRVLAALTLLELKGYVKAGADKSFWLVVTVKTVSE